jgi:NAD(P)-dependent dehydrogenase (short-subunit alcohol dehydrogenase family)
MVNSLIIGGTRGIGLVVSTFLRNRGDVVHTVSRSKIDSKFHICCNIIDDCSVISNTINSIDNVIFMHRYRGGNWSDEFNITVKGVDNVIKTIMPKFSKNASIVIISSNASHFILNEQSAEYHSSRAALEGLMRYYAVKYGPKNIRCNCILPSTVVKPENKDFFSRNNKIRKMIEKITPLGRMGSSEDIANLIEFLCSDKSSYITGNLFYIDGGLSLVGQESIARDILGYNHKK